MSGRQRTAVDGAVVSVDSEAAGWAVGEAYTTETLSYDEAVALAADSNAWFDIEYRFYQGGKRSTAFPASSVVKIEKQ